MSNLLKAKAAVEWADAENLKEWGNSIVIEVFELLRPLAAGTHMLVPIGPMIEFHQWDWIEGFAAFIDDKKTLKEGSTAFCVLNLGAFLSAVKGGDMPKDELPYHIARSMMHEVIHVIEKWCGVEFSEEKVEALLDQYNLTASQEQE